MDYESMDINTLIKLAGLKYLAEQEVTISENTAINDIIKRALVEYLDAA